LETLTPAIARSIDLNADLGEYSSDASPESAALADAILDVVTSANIACGAHAGDLEVMRRTVEGAAERGVAIGAHPSYPDKEGFGRREMEVADAELATQIVSQIEALGKICEAAGAHLGYVKPHGALYNVAASEARVARVIAEAVRAVNPRLILLGLAGSCLIVEGKHAGLTVAREAFADRAYLPDGSLLPRDRAGAVLHDEKQVAERAVKIARDGFVDAVDGARVSVTADSLCIHGDNPKALALVIATRSALLAAGFTLAPFA
jgi:UPF0271 protein